jgi:filamentous hemagglutinin family protein
MALSSLPRLSLRTLRHRPSCPSLLLIVGLLTLNLSTTRQAIAAGLLPQGGRYVVGAGTIAGDGTRLLVTQPGKTRGVIDWNSFSIGKRNTVTFSNGSGATLSRVTGGSPSAILGNLSATGSLYVINPQGVIVGTSGVISTGGRFVASTLDICNDNFAKDGNELTLRGQSDASVTNFGRITSSGGDVILIARHAVINAGSISAPNGTAELAAGETVLLQDSSSTSRFSCRPVVAVPSSTRDASRPRRSACGPRTAMFMRLLALERESARRARPPATATSGLLPRAAL